MAQVFTSRRPGTAEGVTVKVVINSTRVVDLFALGVQFIAVNARGEVVRQLVARFTVEQHGQVFHYISIFSTNYDEVRVMGEETVPEHATLTAYQL